MPENKVYLPEGVKVEQSLASTSAKKPFRAVALALLLTGAALNFLSAFLLSQTWYMEASGLPAGISGFFTPFSILFGILFLLAFAGFRAGKRWGHILAMFMALVAVFFHWNAFASHAGIAFGIVYGFVTLAFVLKAS
jgi:hypothetical protein